MPLCDQLTTTLSFIRAVQTVYGPVTPAVPADTLATETGELPRGTGAVGGRTGPSRDRPIDWQHTANNIQLTTHTGHNGLSHYRACDSPCDYFQNMATV